jgi:hypothetical protein
MQYLAANAVYGKVILANVLLKLLLKLINRSLPQCRLRSVIRAVQAICEVGVAAADGF